MKYDILITKGHLSNLGVVGLFTANKAGDQVLCLWCDEIRRTKEEEFIPAKYRFVYQGRIIGQIDVAKVREFDNESKLEVENVHITRD